MPAATLTGAQLLSGFSNFIDDEFIGATTAAGSVSSLVSTTLSRFGDDSLINMFFRITKAAHSSLFEVRVASDFVSSTGTVTLAPAYDNTTGDTMDFEMHEYEPRRKFAALDSAILSLSDKLPLVVYDETITLDGQGTEIAIPSTIRKGPAMVQIEDPLEPESQWNLLANSRGDTTTSWTLSSNGAESRALYTGGGHDLLIPKYDQKCTKVTVPGSTTVTYRQVVGDMGDDASASEAAGRTMTLGFWVYCQTASRVTVESLDDNGTVATSSSHGGGGWELLTATGTVSSANATTLTVGIAITSSSAAVELYFNRAWFFYGEQMPTHWMSAERFRVRRDDSTQQLILPRGLRGKRQLRLVGMTPLSTLGTSEGSQPTNTVEVDVNTAEIIYAKAAQILLGNQVLSSEPMQDVAIRVRVAEARLADLILQWKSETSVQPRISGPYG